MQSKALKREGALALLVTACAILGFVLFAARYVDDERAQVENNVVLSALNDALTGNANAVAPNTYWDMAYDHIAAPIDKAWAVANLGPYAVQTSNISVVLIFDKAGKLIYSYAPPAMHLTLSHFADDAATQALERKARASKTVPPVTAAGLISVDGRLYLGAASSVVPNDARATKPLERRAVEFYLKEFTPARIAKVEKSFGIAAIALEAKPRATGESAPLKDAAGAVVGYLNWQPQQPGRHFALLLAPVALLCFLLLGILQWRNLARWHLAIETFQKTRAETEHLKRDSWARTMFLANVSHELRTPLNAIIGFSELLSNELLGPLGDPRYKEYAGDIRSGGRHLLEIVNDVLYLTKAEQFQDEMRGECIASEALTIASAILKRNAEDRSVRLEIADFLGPVEIAVSDKVYRQIVTNLGANAIKFSAPQALVRVTQRQSADRRQLELIVEDQGCGIPPDKIQFLGQPFYQVQSSYNRQQGTGLGLAIVKKLVESLGGEIAFTSEVGTGTTVRVRLPLRATRTTQISSAA